jgi:threonine dehydratase
MHELEPTMAEVVFAEHLIRPYAYPTRSRPSDALSERLGSQIFLKPENLQRTGSFKIRGAINRVAELSSDGATSIATASAGNHGQGVGLAAALYGMTATVFVPETASRAKVEALKRMGVDLRFSGRSFDDAQRDVLEFAASTGTPVVSPYDRAVIAGQGTAGYEFVSEVPDLDVLLVPVGSGGLIAGCALAAKTMIPGIRVVGVQAANSPSMVAALEAGQIITVPIEETIADGLEGNIEGGELPFRMIQRFVDDVVLVSESTINEAMRLLISEERLIVEGAGAVGLAALLEGRVDVAGSDVGLLLSGGNVSLETLRSVICE